MLIVDTNVLVKAANAGDPDHEGARVWMEEALGGAEAVGFPWSSIVGFLRITTHARILERPLQIAEAVELARGWLDAPACVLLDPGPGHLDRLTDVLSQTGATGDLIPDAQLAAMALEHDATIVTYDRDFERFEDVRTQSPAG